LEHFFGHFFWTKQSQLIILHPRTPIAFLCFGIPIGFHAFPFWQCDFDPMIHGNKKHRSFANLFPGKKLAKT